MLRAADSVWKTDTGRQRRDNEDSAYVRVPLYVVADGMGGAQAGEVASALAVEEFRRGLPDGDAEHATAEQRLAARVRDANRRIYETAQIEREHSGMGTTLTAVLLDGPQLAIAHVGDSRAYLLRDGELTRLTHDHSLVEELMRRGKLTPEQAAEHPQRSIITRALGIEPDVEVDTWTYPGRAGDVVMLCSDGLTSMVGEDEVADVLRSEPDLDRAGDRLIQAANNAGGRDNITVVLFRLVEADQEAPPQAGETLVGWSPAGEEERIRSTGPFGGEGGGDPPTAQMTVAAPVIERSELPSRSAPRLARTQGRSRAGGHPPKRRSGPLFKVFAALFSILVVLFLFGGGGYLATRELFFVGTNSDGIVTLYSGLPYDFIVPFYETSYVSGLPASEVPRAARARLFNHQLHSQAQAIAIIRQAELGHYPSRAG
jgi:serine/threonine protein phosphatase PrpC